MTNYLAPTPDVTCEYVEPAPVIGYVAPASAAPGSRDLSEASTPMVVDSPLHVEGITALYIYQVQEQIVAGEATQNIVTPVQYAAPTMTGTRVDVNRNGTPDVLQQPQFGLAPQGFATPVLYGAPVIKGMTTVTGADMNCDGIPNLVQQPHSGLATMTVTQVDLTMEEREDLEDQLIAVRDELLDRDEDPELVDLVYQLMEWLYDADTPELADDARATIPRLHHFSAALDTSISRSTTAMRISATKKTSARITASLHSSTALLSGTLWCPSAGSSAGPHHADEELELVVPPPWGT